MLFANLISLTYVCIIVIIPVHTSSEIALWSWMRCTVGSRVSSLGAPPTPTPPLRPLYMKLSCSNHCISLAACLSHLYTTALWLFFFLRFYSFTFRERRREGERENQCVVASHMPSTRNLAWNLGMCPRPGIELVTLWFAGQQSINPLSHTSKGWLFFLIDFFLDFKAPFLATPLPWGPFPMPWIPALHILPLDSLRTWTCHFS